MSVITRLASISSPPPVQKSVQYVVPSKHKRFLRSDGQREGGFYVDTESIYCCWSLLVHAACGWLDPGCWLANKNLVVLADG